MMSYLECKNMLYIYPEEKEPVFTDLSFSLEKGKCLIVQGDNGSGKTTLFRILNGLSFPQKGSYRFDGVSITEEYLKDNAHAKIFHKRIGYLFQNPDIMLFNGKVYDEIAFGPRQMGMSDEETDRRTKECLELFEIAPLADKAPYHLSTGQKKRVALASVLSLNPEVLILDEPYAGLDKKARSFLLSLLKELKAAGKTLIIATHDDQLSNELGDQVLRLGENDE